MTAETRIGIMDETGYLQESEIYAFVQTESGGRLLTGNVTITRSPALHPGDIQCVTAVNVPQDSPLRPLHNVVVFSSKGNRDLPSQLSGGDLDGDLYNIIYDDSLYPRRLAHPADYPTPTPIDIGRMVERSDMTDFFVHFMENDKLGLIATLHQILADQREMGTFDPSCILLAGLHSTAVDFSKTGIPVGQLSVTRLYIFSNDFRSISKKCRNGQEPVRTFKRQAHVSLSIKQSTSKKRTMTSTFQQTMQMMSLMKSQAMNLQAYDITRALKY